MPLLTALEASVVGAEAFAPAFRWRMETGDANEVGAGRVNGSRFGGGIHRYHHSTIDLL